MKNIKVTDEEYEILKRLRDLLSDEFVKSGVVCESRRLIEYTDGQCIELRWYAENPDN
jgi:hypothetical protein